MMTFSKKILLVDYEPHVVVALKNALAQTGQYQFKHEGEIRQVVNAAKWFQPDLILFDINIITPAGEFVARQWQTEPAFQETPLVFLSVDDSLGNVIVSGRTFNGYSFLANPIGLGEFARYVAELVRPPAPKRREQNKKLVRNGRAQPIACR